jgi:uroporphyrinogen-III synthase
MLVARALGPDEVDLERAGELLGGPCAVVLYSRHAVRAAERLGLLELLDERHSLWAVGDKTAAALGAATDLPVETPDEQRFAGLREALARADTLPESVVSLSLRGKLRDLAPVLAPRGVAFVDLPVYVTEPAPLDDLAAQLADFDPHWLAFTSPRGVEVFYEALEGPGGEQRPERRVVSSRRTRRAAIGPSTASALEERGLAVHAVPPAPGVAEMLSLIVEVSRA